MENYVKVPKSFSNYKSEIFWGLGIFQVVNLLIFFALVLVSVYLFFIHLYIFIPILLTFSLLPVSFVLESKGLSYFILLKRKLKANTRRKRYYMENKGITINKITLVTKKDPRSIMLVLVIILLFILIVIGVFSFAKYVFLS